MARTWMGRSWSPEDRGQRAPVLLWVVEEAIIPAGPACGGYARNQQWEASMATQSARAGYFDVIEDREGRRTLVPPGFTGKDLVGHDDYFHLAGSLDFDRAQEVLVNGEAPEASREHAYLMRAAFARRRGDEPAALARFRRNFASQLVIGGRNRLYQEYRVEDGTEDAPANTVRVRVIRRVLWSISQEDEPALDQTIAALDRELATVFDRAIYRLQTEGMVVDPNDLAREIG
jgi:hypothetical protein